MNLMYFSTTISNNSALKYAVPYAGSCTFLENIRDRTL